MAISMLMCYVSTRIVSIGCVIFPSVRRQGVNYQHHLCRSKAFTHAATILPKLVLLRVENVYRRVSVSLPSSRLMNDASLVHFLRNARTHESVVNTEMVICSGYYIWAAYTRLFLVPWTCRWLTPTNERHLICWKQIAGIVCRVEFSIKRKVKGLWTK